MLQDVVQSNIVEGSKSFHTSFVEKHGTVRGDLQRGGELESETPQEKTQQKDGFP